MALLAIFRLHFPIEHFYFDDENFVLPERLWFTNPWEWLSHLLFFNQTRFTWVGDFILVRPGLFAWMWVQDLFRADRLIIQSFIAGVHVFVLITAFFFLRRSAGAVLAAAFALYAVLCVIGRQLYTWPHINGYAVSMGFYVLAAYLFLKEKPSMKWRIVTGISFFLACAFYELTALTLPLLLVAEKWSGKKKNGSRLLTLFIPLCAFGLIVVFAQTVLRPHSLSPIQELTSSENSVSRFLWVWINFFRNLAFVSLPFPTESVALAYIKTVIFFGGLSFLGWKSWRQLSAEDRHTFRMAFVPLIALLLGVGLGRVGPRAVIKEHYFPIFHFFIWLSLAALLGRFLLKSRILYGGALVVLLGSTLWTSLWIDVVKAAPAEEAEAQVNTVNQIRKIVQEKKGCFAGWADYVGRDRDSAVVNSALLQESCARKTATSVFTESFDRMNVHATDLTDSVSLPEVKNELASLQGPISSEILQSYLTSRPPNLAQTIAGSVNGILQLRQVAEAHTSKVLKVQWVSKDEWPNLWNVGLAFESGNIQNFVLIRDNLLELFAFREGQPLATISSPLFSVESPLELKIVKVQGPFCRYYVNALLIFQFAACPVELTKAGMITFDNGTPSEELQSIISQ